MLTIVIAGYTFKFGQDYRIFRIYMKYRKSSKFCQKKNVSPILCE